MQAIQTNDAPKAVGPYSQAIEVNGFVFLSGSIPVTPEGNKVEGPIEDKTHQVMKNLEAILKKAELSFENVVKTEIFVTDLANYAKVNEVYASYMSKPYPARVTVAVKELPLGSDVEISMVAFKG